ncbi:hypothetical protein LIER_30743 [Lithospermum erythrorhizon]|uniref:Uncharacterized protein n=1 Tax=Lithospermum erythrorhizon TaxID=34254 RepID=A0AAV3RUJ3_LITER
MATPGTFFFFFFPFVKMKFWHISYDYSILS